MNEPTLTEFLLARLAEDEARWQMLATTGALHATATFLLADVEAKRRIVERCEGTLAVDGWEYDDAPRLAEEILCDLATIWADHPSYDESWRP